MTKKLLLSMLLAVTATFCVAQTQKNYIGGSMGFNHVSFKSSASGSKKETYSVFSFSPEYGRFLNENLAVGVNVNYNKNNYEGETYDRSSFGGGLYLRKFVINKDKFRLFTGINLRFSQSNYVENFTAIPIEYVENNLTAQIDFGGLLSLTERLSLIGRFGTLGFNREIVKRKLTDDKFFTNNFGLNVNSTNQFNLGLYYSF